MLKLFVKVRDGNSTFESNSSSSGLTPSKAKAEAKRCIKMMYKEMEDEGIDTADFPKEPTKNTQRTLARAYKSGFKVRSKSIMKLANDAYGLLVIATLISPF